MAFQLHRFNREQIPSSEIQIQALREELDTANKEVDRYTNLVATLSEEINHLRRSICHNCRKKCDPSYAPVAPSTDGPRPSLWRRVISGRQVHSPSSDLPHVSTTNAEGSCDTPIPIHPTTAPQYQPEASILAPPQASSSTAPRGPSTTPVDEIHSNQPEWIVSHNPNITQTIHIDLVKTFTFTAMVYCVKFSPDGKYLAAALNKSGKTYIYDVETRSNICFLADLYLKTQPLVWGIQFSPDNKYIATASSDKRIRLWDIARKKMRAAFAGHRNSATTICFSPNSRFLVAGDGGAGLGSVRIWSLRDGSSKELIDDAYHISSVTFSPDGRHIASADVHGWLRIWDTRTSRLLDAWEGHTRDALCVAFSPDGEGLVSGSGDAILRYWDVSSLAVMESGRVNSGIPGQKFQQIRTFEGHTALIRSVSFSPDNRWVVTSSRDRSLRIWDPRTAEWQCTLWAHDGYVRTVDFSPAGKYLASGGKDRQVRLWRYREV